MPSNKTGVFRSTNFFGKKRKFYVVKRGNYFMVQIHPSVAKQHISLNSWIHVSVKYFSGTKWSMNEFPWFDEFLEVFSQKMLMVRKDFWWFFGRFPKTGFTSLTKKWNQDFEVPGLNCFLQTDRVKIAGTVLLLLLDDESCFEKDGYQTCPL